MRIFHDLAKLCFFTCIPVRICQWAVLKDFHLYNFLFISCPISIESLCLLHKSRGVKTILISKCFFYPCFFHPSWTVSQRILQEPGKYYIFFLNQSATLVSVRLLLVCQIHCNSYSVTSPVEVRCHPSVGGYVSSGHLGRELLQSEITMSPLQIGTPE